MKTAINQLVRIYTSQKYALSAVSNENGVILEMKINTQCPQDVYTSYYPNTVKILNEIAPQVLKTTCFNDKELPFCEEAKDTELAHLFEHILIQMMSDLNNSSRGRVIYDATTSWDWETTEYGTFTIYINAGILDLVAFFKAVIKTVEIFNVVIKASV